MKNELSVIVAVLGITCLNGAASPATPVSCSSSSCSLPPSACFSDYLESKSNFYVDVTGGAIFFDGPVKDQSNIYTGNGNGALPVTGHPLNYSNTSDFTGSVGGDFGYILDRHPEEGWMGHNVRAQFGGNYFQTTDSSSTSVSTVGGNYLSEGRLDGLNFTDSGALVRNPFISIGASPAPFGIINFNSHDEVYDAQLVMKSDYSLAHNEFVFTPEVGISFDRIEQRSSTDMYGTTTSAPTFSNEQESINANYYGAVFGFELKANVSKEFVPFLSSVTTIGYAQSGYFGAQEYNSNFNAASINSGDSVSESEGDFFAREQVSGGFYYDFGPVILKVSGGVDYWSNVPTVQEGTVSTGTPVANLNYNVPAAHLIEKSMANPQANVTAIIPF